MAKIVNSGLALIAQLQAAEQSLSVDKFIFANIDGLDFQTEVPATEVMPDTANIVLEADVANKQFVTNNAVLYSCQLGADVGDFSFNWIGLYDTTHTTLIAVAYVPLQAKWANSLERTGNILVKNFCLQYSDISALSGIDINADPSLSPDYFLAQAAGMIVASAISDHEQNVPHLSENDLPDVPGAIEEHETKDDPHSQYAKTVNFFLPNSTTITKTVGMTVAELQALVDEVPKNQNANYRLDINVEAGTHTWESTLMIRYFNFIVRVNGEAYDQRGTGQTSIIDITDNFEGIQFSHNQSSSCSNLRFLSDFTGNNKALYFANNLSCIAYYNSFYNSVAKIGTGICCSYNSPVALSNNYISSYWYDIELNSNIISAYGNDIRNGRYGIYNTGCSLILNHHAGAENIFTSNTTNVAYAATYL